MVELSSAVESRRIAMLIDGDNAQSSLIQKMLTEAGKYGLVTIRRIYGDWTTANMKCWKETLHGHAIQPIQQFRYTTGKNATDSAMIIDAMDILYDGVVNGFCLVSSDSDYTRLATRIREKGIFVMGIGKKSTPRAFVNACEIFIYAENLLAEVDITRPKATKPPKKARAAEQVLPELLPLLMSAFEMAVQDDGWAFLGTMGSRLRQLDPGFDPRTYGNKQLSLLIRTYSDAFEVKEVKSQDGPSVIYVKLRDSRTA